MSATVQQRIANLSRAMHHKAAELLGQRTNMMLKAAIEYYKLQGRGALLFKFMNEEELLHKSKRVVVLYVPLEMSDMLEYDELPRHIRAYDPQAEYVLLLCVSTPLVEGGELMQASTARPRRVIEAEDAADEAEDTEVYFCGYCYAEDAHFKCGRCGDVRYCNKTCQRDHWVESHKGSCSGGAMLD